MKKKIVGRFQWWFLIDSFVCSRPRHNSTTTHTHHRHQQQQQKKTTIRCWSWWEKSARIRDTKRKNWKIPVMFRATIPTRIQRWWRLVIRLSSPRAPATISSLDQVISFLFIFFSTEFPFFLRLIFFFHQSFSLSFSADYILSRVVCVVSFSIYSFGIF